MDIESKVQLTRMEGKLDLMNERHETMKGDLTEVKTRLHAHGNRIQVLEADKQHRAGAVGAVKWLWAAGGLTVTGVAAIVLRAMGV